MPTYKLERVHALSDLRLEVVEPVGIVLALLRLAFAAAHLLVDLGELVEQPIQFATHGAVLLPIQI